MRRVLFAASLAGMLIGVNCSVAYCQAGAGGGAGGAGGGAAPGAVGASGGLGGAGGAGVGGASSTINGSVGGAGTGGSGIGGGTLGGGGIGAGIGSGAHQGHILTGPGATGIPQNYFRGAAPGMSQSPQEAPSGASNSVLNPLRPGARSGRGLGTSRRKVGGNGAVARGVGPVPKGGEENPAETLLDEMNGTRNGRRTGHAALRPPPRYQRGVRGLSSDPPSLAPRRIEERAVYFAKRGAYEDMVYRPYQGSYRQQHRRTAVVAGRRTH